MLFLRSSSCGKQCCFFLLGCALTVSSSLAGQTGGAQTASQQPADQQKPGSQEAGQIRSTEQVTGEQPAAAPAAAPATPPPPAYQDLRYLEDWTSMRDPARRVDYLDSSKYVSLGEEGWYSSFGGEIRYRVDWWHDANFGYIPARNLGAFFQRYLLHNDTHFGKNVRLFTEFASALENGKEGGPWPTDRDEAEVHQAFLEVHTAPNAASGIALRVGRQEIAFGQSHFVSTSDFYNTRRAFDGVRLQAWKNNLEFNAVVAKPKQINVGLFNDSPEHRQTFTAAGIFAPNPFTQRGRTALFYLGLDSKFWFWERGPGRDKRHTVGARILGFQGNFDYVYEALLQWGSFQNWMPIRAWAITTDTGYRVTKWKYYPRFGLRLNVTSGDRRKLSLGTFNPMFPDNAYSGKIGLIGPANSIDVTPNLQFVLTRNIFFIPDLSFFWRESTRDGIYGVVVPYLVTPGSFSKERYVGTQFSLPLQINLSRHFTYTVAFAHLFAGAFLKDLSPPGRSVTFLTNFVTYRF